MFYSAVVLCCIFVLWLIYSHYFRPYYIVKRALRLSGPSPRIYTGNCSQIQKLGWLESATKWMSQYGPTFVYYFGIMPMVLSQDLEIIKSVTVKNFNSFVNRPRVLGVRKGKVQGILQMRDEQWSRVRRILTHAFSSKKLKMISPLIQENCKRLRNKMMAVSDSGNHSSVDVKKLFGTFTMDVVLATEFSRDISLDGGKEHPLTSAAASVFQSASLRGPRFERIIMVTSHFPWIAPILRFLVRTTNHKLTSSFDYIEETASQLVEDRRSAMMTTESMPQDLLQLMLEAHDENEENKSNVYLNNEEIVSLVVSFILAGYETTAAALSFTAYLLALNPTIQDRLVREIKEYYDVNPDSSLYDAAENIEYVTMVVNESLRMYPPTSRIIRECKQTCAITDELVLEKGMAVSFIIYLLHHNPEYWPNPEKFDPERFNPNNERSYPTLAYIPFGEGPRNCIAKRLALLEAKMTLVAILKDVHFKRTTETEVPLDLSFGVTMTPKNGVKLSIVSNC